nr:hypothetical protein [Desulfobacterales bacterium]
MNNSNQHNRCLDIVRDIAKESYNRREIARIEHTFRDVCALFEGKMAGYQGCDTLYHDIEHTLQVLPPYAQIIDGWNKAGQRPYIPFSYFELGVIAALLHDTGYMKKEGDTEGTGAKYTFRHEELSVDFCNKYLSKRGFKESEIASVANIIRCTGVMVRVETIPFTCKEERIVGYAVGVADLLGQMSAENYVQKLTILYKEFQEGYRFEGEKNLKKKGIPIFKDANELIKNTPSFYYNTVLERFKAMGSLERYVIYHFPERYDPYKIRIEHNLDLIRSKYRFPGKEFGIIQGS